MGTIPSSPPPVRRRRSLLKPVADCPVEQAINIIGGKWKMLVLRSLLLNGTQRYNDLLVSVTRISPKELTRNLRQLTDSGLVSPRTTRDEPYALTPLGTGLLPAFKRLLPWGRRLISASRAA
jgi:DNA-binding HxlR family transcriptional regulator